MLFLFDVAFEIHFFSSFLPPLLNLNFLICLKNKHCCWFPEANQYMAFGISGSPTTNRMVGGDVVVAGVDQSTISGFAQDYYLLDKSQCIVQQETGQVSGSCPDSNIQVSAGITI